MAYNVLNMSMWGICETQADEFMAFYYKSIDQPLKPCRPITYIYCCMSFLIAYNGLAMNFKNYGL